MADETHMGPCDLVSICLSRQLSLAHCPATPLALLCGLSTTTTLLSLDLCVLFILQELFAPYFYIPGSLSSLCSQFKCHLWPSLLNITPHPSPPKALPLISHFGKFYSSNFSFFWIYHILLLLTVSPNSPFLLLFPQHWDTSYMMARTWT